MGETSWVGVQGSCAPPVEHTCLREALQEDDPGLNRLTPTPLPRSGGEGSKAASWLQDTFEAVILLVAERAIGPWRFVQRQAMADQEAGIDLAATDALQE